MEKITLIIFKRERKITSQGLLEQGTPSFTSWRESCFG